jgi:hypothetical protein
MKPTIRNWMRKAFQDDKKALKEILPASVFALVEQEAKDRKKAAKKDENEHSSASQSSVEK